LGSRDSNPLEPITIDLLVPTLFGRLALLAGILVLLVLPTVPLTEKMFAGHVYAATIYGILVVGLFLETHFTRLERCGVGCIHLIFFLNSSRLRSCLSRGYREAGLCELDADIVRSKSRSGRHCRAVSFVFWFLMDGLVERFKWVNATASRPLRFDFSILDLIESLYFFVGLIVFIEHIGLPWPLILIFLFEPPDNLLKAGSLRQCLSKRRTFL